MRHTRQYEKRTDQISHKGDNSPLNASPLFRKKIDLSGLNQPSKTFSNNIVDDIKKLYNKNPQLRSSNNRPISKAEHKSFDIAIPNHNSQMSSNVNSNLSTPKSYRESKQDYFVTVNKNYDEKNVSIDHWNRELMVNKSYYIHKMKDFVQIDSDFGINNNSYNKFAQNITDSPNNPVGRNLYQPLRVSSKGGSSYHSPLQTKFKNVNFDTEMGDTSEGIITQGDEVPNEPPRHHTRQVNVPYQKKRDVSKSPLSIVSSTRPCQPKSTYRGETSQYSKPLLSSANSLTKRQCCFSNQVKFKIFDQISKRIELLVNNGEMEFYESLKEVVINNIKRIASNNNQHGNGKHKILEALKKRERALTKLKADNDLDNKLAQVITKNNTQKRDFLSASLVIKQKKEHNEQKLEQNVRNQVECYLFELNHIWTNDPDRCQIEDAHKYYAVMEEDTRKFKNQLENLNAEKAGIDQNLLNKHNQLQKDQFMLQKRLDNQNEVNGKIYKGTV